MDYCNYENASLAEYEDSPAVDLAAPGDHRVSRVALLLHAEVAAGVLHELVVLYEGVGVAEDGDPLARSQLPLGVLRRDALLAPAQLSALRGLLDLRTIMYISIIGMFQYFLYGL